MSAIAQVPSDFSTALDTLRRARCRRELRLEEIPGPERLAPYTVALAAEVWPQQAFPQRSPTPHQLDPAEDSESPLAAGRFILLHDPKGSPVWEGTFRIVTYIRAQVEADMGNDTLIGSVAWTWLVEALEKHHVEYRAAGGTATRILSESFGSLSGRPEAIDIELRASWTPLQQDMRKQLEAWSDMVCMFAGLPPLPEGVSALPQRRS